MWQETTVNDKPVTRSKLIDCCFIIIIILLLLILLAMCINVFFRPELIFVNWNVKRGKFIIKVHSKMPAEGEGAQARLRIQDENFSFVILIIFLTCCL